VEEEKTKKKRDSDVKELLYVEELENEKKKKRWAGMKRLERKATLSTNTPLNARRGFNEKRQISIDGQSVNPLYWYPTQRPQLSASHWEPRRDCCCTSSTLITRSSDASRISSRRIEFCR